MLVKIREILQHIKALLPFNQYSYRLAEINHQSQEVILHMKNKGLFFKCSLSDAITNLTILNELSPLEASWLGGYYGRALRASMEHGTALKKAKNMTVLLKSPRGLYRIAFQERSGEIGYCNQKTKEILIEHPITIATNEHIITRFDSSQACYIGILAGIILEKITNKDKKTGQNNVQGILQKPPKLRVVE